MSEDYTPVGRLRVHGGGIIRFAIKAGELYAFIDPTCIEDKGVIILKEQSESSIVDLTKGGPDAKYQGPAGQPIP